MTELYDELMELLKNESYEWDEKVHQFNPMKLYIWAYTKDLNKGIEVMDEAAIREQEKNREQEAAKQI